MSSRRVNAPQLAQDIGTHLLQTRTLYGLGFRGWGLGL